MKPDASLDLGCGRMRVSFYRVATKVLSEEVTANQSLK